MNTATRWANREDLALLTDFYQITMAGGYFANKKDQQRVCFEYFFRSLPAHNGFAITAGLEQFLQYIQNLRFQPEDLTYLQSLNQFDESFIEALKNFKFTGDIYAVPEGSIVFPGEPIVQIVAPLIEAQLIETFLLNALNYPTLIATKAARVCYAAHGDSVLEFGLRRAQGPDGGLCGSRAAYIGGCSATSNVLAGRLWNIPIKGTHAHSWVMSYSTELEAFRAYVAVYPENPILLVDTYNTLESGVPNAIKVFKELQQKNPNVRAGIRLDSGDLAKLSKEAYAQLINAGFENPLIVASNDLEEELIADIKRQGAKINAWGVGTHLITSKDHPALGGVYKLVDILETDGKWVPRMKLSQNPAKTTDPARKRFFRAFDQNQMILGDILCHWSEEAPMGEKLVGIDPIRLNQKIYLTKVEQLEEMLKCVIKNGQLIVPHPSIKEIKQYTEKQILGLPAEYQRLKNPELYRVLLSPTLAEIKQTLMDTLHVNH